MVYFSKIRKDIVSVLNNVFIFKYTYIIVTFISFIPVTRIYIGFITKFILIWGAYLIINKIFLKREYDKKSGIFLLSLLIISYCITIILNYKNDFARNVLNISYLSINLLVVYGLTEKKKLQEYMEGFQRINLLVIIISGLASLISIIMFVFLVKYKLTVDNMHVNQGFIYNRLYGIYSSANAAGMLAVLSIAVTLINLLLKKHKFNNKLRIMYIANIVIQIIYIILSDSRGAQVASISLFTVMMLLFFKEKLLNKREGINKKNILKYIISIMLCAVVSVTALALKVPGQKALSYIPDFMSNFIPYMKQNMLLNDDDLIPYKNLTDLIEQGTYNKSTIFELQNKNSSNAPKSEKVPAKSNSVKESSSIDESVNVGRDSYEVTGNRLTIWEAQLKLWKEKPIFGIANSTMSFNKKKFDSIKTLTNRDRSELLRSDGNCHNGFLQLLVIGGVVAFLLFVVFWIFLFKKTVQSILFSNSVKQYNPIVIITFAIVISLLINNLSESHIILRNADFIGVLTWVYTGYLFNFINSFMKSDTGEVI